MAAIKALQLWCKIQCDGYRDVEIHNMTTSFRNGLAFCAILHKFRPDLINFESLRKEDVYDNNHLAFRMAEEQLGIPALLDAEDMVVLAVPDRLSILTYVSQYYNYFNGRSPTGGVGGVKRPAEGSKEEPSEKKNLPVVATTYRPKTQLESCPPPATATVMSKTSSRENRPPALITHSDLVKHSSNATTTQQNTHSSKHTQNSVSPSRKPHKAAEEKIVLAESSNKTGTLNSKCAVCRSHVHLVQRHLVDGKLYHRGCFKCSECSAPLQSGTWQAGQDQGVLLCSSHLRRNSLASRGSDPRPEVVRGQENEAEISKPRHISVLCSPVKAVSRPPDPGPVVEPWTASAQRTQAARRSFFLSKEAALPSHCNTANPPVESPVSKISVGARTEDEKDRARAVIARKLSEGNCNNNNKAYSSGFKADGKTGSCRSSVEFSSYKPGIPGSAEGERSDQRSLTNAVTTNRGSLYLSSFNKEQPRPSSISRVKDLTGDNVSTDWQRKQMVPNGSRPRVDKPDTSENKLKLTSSNVHLKDQCPPSGPTSKLSNNICLADRFSTKSTSTDPQRQDPAASVLKNETHTSSFSLTGGTGASINSSSMAPPRPAVPAPVETRHGSARWAPQCETSFSSSANGRDSSSDRLLGGIIKSRGAADVFPFHEPRLDDSVSLRDFRKPRESSPKQARHCAPLENGSENGNMSSNSGMFETKLAVLKPQHHVFAHHIPMERIAVELQEIEDSLNNLEKKGIELERRLRRCEDEGSGDVLMDPLMVDWFNLIRKKQNFMRRESELMYIVKTQDLEEQQPGVEGELRRLINKPEHLKSAVERKRECELMKRLVEIVNDRNAIVEGLEEDRLREEEEDQQLNEMMHRLGLKRQKSRRKSSFSKLFRRRSKKAMVEV